MHVCELQRCCGYPSVGNWNIKAVSKEQLFIIILPHLHTRTQRQRDDRKRVM